MSTTLTTPTATKTEAEPAGSVDVATFFEQLSPADLDRLDRVYTEQARFKDPFNEVQGLAAIRGVYAHMYVALEQPRFEVKTKLQQGSQCLLTWDFRFRMRRFNREEQCIHGATLLTLASDGRIEVHRDYWDAAEELYEKLPLLGGFMRWLKARARS